MLRIIRWTATGLLVLVLIGWGATWMASRDPQGPAARGLQHLAAAVGLQPASTGGVAAGLNLGGPFTLVDSAGKPVTDKDFRGKWMLVYFGYTFCPDVCPTELQTIASALDSLGPTAANLVPIFITVDPQRDTPSAMGQYTKLFDPRLIGLTGTPDQIADVTRAYRVYYAKVTPKGATTYLMDHSSFAYLMAPDGSFRALLRPGLSADEMTEQLQKQLTHSS
jgi:cytochrome oxidase Cu insertion factor (SCO1/SenC/PrrC family)